MQQLKPKEPWLAVVLSLVIPGAGQYYSSSKTKGILFFLAEFGLISFALHGLLSERVAPSFFHFFGLFAGLLLPVIILFDAHKTAGRFNQERKGTLGELPYRKKTPWLAVFLSFLYPGIGQFYNLNIGKGILFLIVSTLLDTGTTRLGDAFSKILPFLTIPFLILVLYDAFIGARKVNWEESKIPLAKKNIQLLITVLVVIHFFGSYIGLGIEGEVKELKAYRITSSSMEPTTMKGERVWADKSKRRLADLKRGDIVVFNNPEDKSKSYIKRITAQGGDKIELREGSIYLNDEIIEAPYLNIGATQVDAQQVVGHWVVSSFMSVSVQALPSARGGKCQPGFFAATHAFHFRMASAFS